MRCFCLLGCLVLGFIFIGCQRPAGQTAGLSASQLADYKTGVAVLFFTDQSCGPCDVQTVELQQALRMQNFRLLTIVPNKEMIRLYKLKVFPTVLILNDNREMWRAVGLVSHNEILAALNRAG